MRCQVDDEIRLRLMLDRVRVASRRHQPGVKVGVGSGEVSDEGAIEPNQAIAVVKIGKRQPVREGKISHRVRDPCGGRQQHSADLYL